MIAENIRLHHEARPDPLPALLQLLATLDAPLSVRIERGGVVVQLTAGPAGEVAAPGTPPLLATKDELRWLAPLLAGALTGSEWAQRLDMEPTGGGFTRKVQQCQERGLVWNPGKGYRLTVVGRRALESASATGVALVDVGAAP